MTDVRPVAVGLMPRETRCDVVLHVATRAEELGFTALYPAEGWGRVFLVHDRVVVHGDQEDVACARGPSARTPFPGPTW